MKYSSSTTTRIHWRNRFWIKSQICRLLIVANLFSLHTLTSFADDTKDDHRVALMAAIDAYAEDKYDLARDLSLKAVLLANRAYGSNDIETAATVTVALMMAVGSNRVSDSEYLKGHLDQIKAKKSLKWRNDLGKRAGELKRAFLARFAVHFRKEYEYQQIGIDLPPSFYDNPGPSEEILDQVSKRFLVEVSKRFHGPRSEAHADNLITAASSFAKAGQLNIALEYARDSLVIRESLHSPNYRQEAKTLHIIGKILSQQNRHEEALTHYEGARKIINLALRDRKSGNNDPKFQLEFAKLLHSIGLTHAEMQNFPQAEMHIKLATKFQENARSIETLETNQDLVELYIRSREFESALELIKSGLILSEKIIATGIYDPLSGDQSEFSRIRKRQIDSALSLATLMDTSIIRRIAATAVLQHKGRSLDSLVDSLFDKDNKATIDFEERLQSVNSTHNALSNLIFRGKGDLTNSEYNKRLSTLLRVTKSSGGAAADPDKPHKPTRGDETFTRVCSAIKGSGVLIEFLKYKPFLLGKNNYRDWWGDDHYIALVIQDCNIRIVDVGLAKEVEVAIGNLRSAISNPRSTLHLTEARNSYNIIFDPLNIEAGRDTRLIISPDSQLWSLPFEALLDKSNKFLVQSRNITYVNSGNELSSIENRSTTNSNRSVIIADPDFNSSDLTNATSEHFLNLKFDRLKNAEAEAISIKNILQLDHNDLILGKDATEPRIKQIKSPLILHFATHGFFLTSDSILHVGGAPSYDWSTRLGVIGSPLFRSGLALAGANSRRSGESSDGLLTAAEIMSMNLSGTRLVVLSACDTGIGIAVDSDGVFGLRRAFSVAGAESMLVSLWAVSDRVTKSFMEEYYRQLKYMKAGRSESLRRAQLSLLSKTETSHPYYWASFVSVGAWGPIF